MCHVCKTSTTCHAIPMPYVTRYLVNELAAMNIKVTFDVEKISCWRVSSTNGGSIFNKQWVFL